MSSLASGNGKRVVLITGCTPGGIGYALVEEFYSRGLHVIATARNSDALSTIARIPSSMTSNGGKISTLALDVTKQESISEAVEKVKELTGGRLDILVNNAGRAYPIPALDADMATSKSVFDTNVFGVMAMTQAFAPLMVSTAASLPARVPKPQIVMIGSISAVNPYTFGSVYNASKAALHAYSNTLRLELQPFDVGVVLVVTGGVQSNIAVMREGLHHKPPEDLIELPSNSLYLPIQAQYNRRQTHSQEGATPSRAYAKQVADAALQGKHEVWRGNKSWLVYFIMSVFGRWVLDRIMIKTFGLDVLKRIWRSKMKQA